MQQQHTSPLTPGEYLELERRSEVKNEYWNGEIYAMAGASSRHSLIAANVIASFHARLKGSSCTVYTGDLRVKVNATGLYTYPDVVVVCGTADFDDRFQDTLENPAVIVEVLSKSTESYDRGVKFEHYRTLDSLTDYLLVSQDTACVEHRMRHSPDKWLLGIYQGLESVVPMPSLVIDLPLAEVYESVEWSTVDAARGWLRFIKEPGEPDLLS